MVVTNESVEKLLILGKQQKYLKESQIAEVLNFDMGVDAIEAVYSAIERANIDIVPDSNTESVPAVDPSADWAGGAQDSISMYLKEIGQHKIPTPEEEKEWTNRVFLGNEAAKTLTSSDANIDEMTRQELQKAVSVGKEAKDHLTEANLRLVVSIARRYKNCGLPLLDLIQEGNLGLMKAIDKFEPGKGYRLTTYASWWIMQRITRSLANMSRLVRIPVHISADIGALARANRQLQAKIGDTPTMEELTGRTGFSADYINMLMNISQAPLSMDATVSQDEDSVLGDIIADTEAENPDMIAESDCLRENLLEFMDTVLNEKEREVLSLRFGLGGNRPWTLQKLGSKYGVTRERIRQIEARALRKMKKPRLAKKLAGYIPDQDEA